jgi:uncharacterized caspase-like protein
MKHLVQKKWWKMAPFGMLIFLSGFAFTGLAQPYQKMTPQKMTIDKRTAQLYSYMESNTGKSASIWLSRSDYDDDRGILVVEKAVKKKGQPRFALIIGNAEYQHIPMLANPSNDAFDMKQALDQLGFEVVYLPNAANRRVMVEAVREFGNQLMHHPDAVGLFFYAGHAMQINGVNYLIPVDAVIKGEADVEFETLNVNYLLQTMDMAENGMNIIIMDACRNNPYERGFRGGLDRGLAPMDSPTGSIIAFATAPGKTAADGTGRNGTFTKHLLQYIQQPELTIEQMLKQVRVAVIEETGGSQTPWETSSLQGDFCFTGCPDQAVLEREALKKAEDEMKQQMREEQQRLEKERTAMKAEWAKIEAKKLEMRIKAAEAQQHKDQEALDKILKEQETLTQQRLLIEKEQDRIEQQKEVLTDKNTNHFQKEDDIARLKEEREQYESERAKLEQIRAEVEEARRRTEAVRRERKEAESENRNNRPVVMPLVGF